MEHIECGACEGPVDEGLKFEQEWYRHEALQCELVGPGVVVHHEVALLHFGDSVSDLESTYPEIAAVKDVKYDECGVASEFIAHSASHTIRVVLQLHVPVDREEPEH